MKVYLSPFDSVHVETFSDASKAVSSFIEENDLGGEEFYGEHYLLSKEARLPYIGGEILDDNGMVIAIVSYNGTVWRPLWNRWTEVWVPGSELLYSPYQKSELK
jgi:hypothetical protein